MTLTEDQVQRKNHRLRPNILNSKIRYHWLVFFDIESYVEKETGIQHPRLLCAEFVLTDRNYNLVQPIQQKSYLWKDADNFVIDLLKKTIFTDSDVSLFAHYIFYDLFVSDNPEIKETIDTHDVEVAYKKREYLTIHTESIFDRLLRHNYKPQVVGKSKTRFFLFTPPDGVVKKGKNMHYKNALTVIDTMNYFKSSVKSLGKDFGINKLNIEEEEDEYGNKGFNIDIAEDPDMFKKVLEYCKRDVEIIRTATLNLFQITSANLSVPYSISSAAWGLYTNKYLPTVPIYIHDKAKALILENECYKGARTEVIKHGLIPNALGIDKINHYPSQMLHNYFPYRPLKRKDGGSAYYNFPKSSYKKVAGSVYKMVADREDVGLCAKVVVNVPTHFKIGPLPYTLKNEAVAEGKDNRLLFPVGRFTTFLCTPEFKLAYENGWIEEVHEVSYYKMIPIFTLFVSDLHEKLVIAENEGKIALRRMLKLILNSVFGKWGQKTKKLVKIGDTQGNFGIDKMEIDNQIRYVNIIGGGKFVYEKVQLGYNAFPAIAAHISSYSRLEMWRSIQKIGEDNIYYIDNDGLKVNQQGLDNIVDEIGSGNELGKFKYEGQGKIEIRASKAYTWWCDKHMEANGGKPMIREKGIKESSIHIGDLVKQERPTSLNDLLYSGGVSPTMSKTETKRRSLEINGRQTLPDGWTKPAELFEVPEKTTNLTFKEAQERFQPDYRHQPITVIKNVESAPYKEPRERVDMASILKRAKEKKEARKQVNKSDIRPQISDDIKEID